MIDEGVIGIQKQQKKKFLKKKIDVNPNLPIFSVKDQLIESLEQNQVVIITGNTGCGKSTQVPQILFNKFRDGGERINIICSQPRRLAAISLAERVSDEQQVNVGDRVGYQVGMDAKLCDKTRILFVTTVMDEVHERDIDIDFSLIIIKHFLKVFPGVKLILMSATICAEKFSNYFAKNSIQNIDNEEIMMELQKRFLKPKVKTEEWITTDLTDWALGEEGRLKKELENQQFEKLFKEQEKYRYLGKQFLVGDDDQPAPIIEIQQGERFPIYLYYLETISEFFDDMNVKFEHQYMTSVFYNSEATFQEESIKVMLKILYHVMDPQVLNNVNKMYGTPKQGSMLIFLPGYSEIMDVRDAILERFSEKHIKIVLLHSSITTSQRDIQSKDNSRFRIFLCTNIAESSITVPDCLFVIDFCLTKQIEYNPKNLTEKLSLQYCSQASSNQRRGRVGRLFAGICFRLVPEDFYNTRMIAYSQCEMLRCPLEKIVLRIKKLDQLERDIIDQAVKQEEVQDMQSQDVRQRRLTIQQIKVQNLFSNTERTLATALDPPAADQIGNSMRNLQHLGALTIINNQYKNELVITSMGLFMCEMPIDIFLTRYIVTSCMFGIILEGITVASLLSQRRNFFLHQFGRNQENFLDTLYSFDLGDEDDVLLQLRIFSEWENLFYNKFIQEQNNSSIIDTNNIDSNKNQSQINHHRINLRKFNRQPISNVEKQYSIYRSVDLKNLREILLQKYELLSRVENYFPVPNEKMIDFNNTELILKLKSAFGASFQSKAMSVKREESKDIDRRIQQIQQLKQNPHRVLQLEGITTDINNLTAQAAKQLRDRVGGLFEEFFEMNCFNTLQQIRNALIIDLKKNEQFNTNVFVAKEMEYFKEQARIRAKNQKKWITAVEFHSGSIVIMLSERQNMVELIHIIKRLLHQLEIEKRGSIRLSGPQKLKQQDLNLSISVLNPIQNRVNIDPRFISQLMSTKSLFDMIRNLGCSVNYACIARCYGQPNLKEIQHDYDSINFIQTSLAMGKQDHEKYLAAFDIKERETSKRNYARISCKINWQPYYGPIQWMQTVAILFGCNVKLVPNESKTHFEKAVVDKRTFYLDHYIMEEDVTQLNLVRDDISKALLTRSGYDNCQIWDKLKDIMEQKKIKIHFNIDEKWVRVFEEDKKIFLREIRKETLQFQDRRRRRGIALSLLDSHKMGSGMDDFRSNFQGDLGKFMQEIDAQRPDYDQEYPRQFDHEGLRLFGQMKQLYMEWKKEQINQLAKLRILTQRYNQAIFLCNQCQSNLIQLGSTRGLKYLDEDEQLKVLVQGDSAKMNWFRRELQVLNVNIFSDQFEICEDRKIINEFSQKKYLGQLLEKLQLTQDFAQYHFVSCISQEHIFGICPKSMAPGKDQIMKIIITNKSLQLMYPNLEAEEYNFRLLKHEALIIKQQEKFIEQQDKLKSSQFYCKICVGDTVDGFRGNFQEIQKHLNSQAHKQNYDDLQKSLS